MRGFGDVDSERGGLAARELLCRAFQRYRIEVGEHDAGAFGEKEARRRHAQAARAARQNSDLAVQPAHSHPPQDFRGDDLSSALTKSPLVDSV
jgi:hypothetical protein